MPPCIALKHVTKSYGAAVAVSDLSLEIEKGEVFGLLGPNGAGKSTTLYMLAGLVRPDTGAISIFAKDQRKHALAIAKRTGVLVERPVFFDYLSARRNLKIQARLAGRDVNVDRALDLAGMLHQGDKKAGHLSLGLRQRLGLAQAMLTEPELLILDEPASGLDVESAQEMLRLLRRIADEARVTILFSSHQMFEVEALCDRVAILNEGRLIACDKTESLLAYDVSQVEVLLEGAEAAAKRLTEQPWVVSAEARQGRVRVRLRDAQPQQLMQFLLGAGYHLDGVIPKRRTLQEYFLKTLNHDVDDTV